MEALDSIYWIYVKLKLDCYWVIIYLQCLSIGKWNKKARFTAVGLGKFRVITLLKYNSCLSSVVFLLCAVSHIECLSAIFVYTDTSKFMLVKCFAGQCQIFHIKSGTLLMVLINTHLPCWLDASIKLSIDSKHNALSATCRFPWTENVLLHVFQVPPISWMSLSLVHSILATWSKNFCC